MSCRSEAGLWLDVSRLVRRQAQGIVPTGIDRVALAYAAHFAGRAGLAWRQRPLLAWVPPAAAASVLARLQGAVDGAAGPGRDDAAAAAAWRPRLAAAALLAGLPWRAATGARPLPGDVLLHVTHSDLDDADYIGRWTALGLRPVVLVHDLIPIEHPAFARAGEAQRHVRRMRHVLQAARGIVVNSAATADALAAFAREQSLPLPPVQVAWLGCRPLVDARPAGQGAPDGTPDGTPGGTPGGTPDGDPRPYFVMLGTLEPRKNHLLMLAVWRELLARHGERTPRLILIGRRGWAIEALVRQLDGDAGLRPVVTERAACADAELAVWLRGARALLFPSMAEGFGLPVVEALAAGVPVIASDLPVCREVAGAVPDYADPQDAGRWRALIEDHARPDSPLRAAQLQRLPSFRPPTWAAHFDRVEAFIRRLS